MDRKQVRGTLQVNYTLEKTWTLLKAETFGVNQILLQNTASKLGQLQMTLSHSCNEPSRSSSKQRRTRQDGKKSNRANRFHLQSMAIIEDESIRAAKIHDIGITTDHEPLLKKTIARAGNVGVV
jgi:hypothetical protein